MEIKTESIREQKKMEKKQRIQEAAIKVMARQGYHGTTVSQIAKEAGVADGTLYLYFENKEDMLLKIIDEIMDRFIDEGEIMVERGGLSPIETLKGIARLHLEKLGADADLAWIFQIELRHNVKFMKFFSETKLRRYFSIVEKVIQRAQAAGQIRPEIDTWITAKILFGALDETSTNWVLGRRDYDLVSMAAPTLDILLNGMCASREV